MNLFLVGIGVTVQAVLSALLYRWLHWLVSEQETQRQELTKLRMIIGELGQACDGLRDALAAEPKATTTPNVERLRDFLNEQYQPSGGRWPMREHSTWQPPLMVGGVREPIKE